ncbi:LPXTG cell wall anchor domain-containing protein [Agromyces sp. NPDC057865]|uniref:LPXTG cell wall anchor domain-containing protein n=1 Tax=Agromyces sp. NPDC057865 TaxID=3346267 RepID=UPI0036721C9E
MRRSSVPETRDRDGRWRDVLRRAAATTIAVVLAGGLAGLAAGPASAEEDPVEVAAVVTSDIGVEVTPLSCSTSRDGVTFVSFTNLIPGNQYLFDVEGPAFSVGAPFEAESDVEEREFVGMPPGNYYVYVQESFPPEEETVPNYDWIAFAVEPCQPAMEVAVTQCTVAGGTGGVDVTLSRLVAGVEYAVWVTDAGDAGGTPYGDPQIVTGDGFAEASASFASLPGGRSYTVWVDGTWTAEPYEEPPFLGGGNFVPLTTVDLTTSADVSLAACPAAPVTPASSPTTLPATGPDGTGPALLAGLLLAGSGAALLALSLRRRRAAARG